MRIKLFSGFINEKLGDEISFDLLDVSKFSDKLIDLKDEGFDFTITPTIYNYFNGRLSKEYPIASKHTPAEVIRYLRKSSTGSLSPGFKVVIQIPTEFKSMSVLFNMLSVIQDRYSDEYKFDFKQEKDGYHLDFISKIEEELGW